MSQDNQKQHSTAYAKHTHLWLSLRSMHACTQVCAPKVCTLAAMYLNHAINNKPIGKPCRAGKRRHTLVKVIHIRETVSDEKESFWSQ